VQPVTLRTERLVLSVPEISDADDDRSAPTVWPTS
jgi:hypothetical protein